MLWTTVWCTFYCITCLMQLQVLFIEIKGRGALRQGSYPMPASLMSLWVKYLVQFHIIFKKNNAGELRRKYLWKLHFFMRIKKGLRLDQSYTIKYFHPLSDSFGTAFTSLHWKSLNWEQDDHQHMGSLKCVSDRFRWALKWSPIETRCSFHVCSVA